INFHDLETRRQFEYKKFGVMLNYASRFRKHCYRSFILSYFGEWSRNRQCGNCSRCTPEKYPRNRTVPVAPAMPSIRLAVQQPSSSPTVTVAADSATIVALKIISCVLRVQQK